MQKNSTLYKIIQNKAIVWFEKNNSRVVLQNTTATILKQLQKKTPVKEIGIAISKKLEVLINKTINLILELESNLFTEKYSEKSGLENEFSDLKRPRSFKYINFYKIHNIVFKVSCLPEKKLAYVHSKFDHLTINTFHKLITNSCLSTKKVNIQKFLYWFSVLNCCELLYANNAEIITSVQKVFNDDV
jgi:hypothetical protein